MTTKTNRKQKKTEYGSKVLQKQAKKKRLHKIKKIIQNQQYE